MFLCLDLLSKFFSIALMHVLWCLYWGDCFFTKHKENVLIKSLHTRELMVKRLAFIPFSEIACVRVGGAFLVTFPYSPISASCATLPLPTVRCYSFVFITFMLCNLVL